MQSSFYQIFNSLPQAEVVILQAVSKLVPLFDEQCLIHRKGQSPKVYWLIEGALCVWAEDENGLPRTLNIAAPGEFVGEMHAVDNLGHSANVTALGLCQLRCFEGEEFVRCMESLPGLASLVARQNMWRVRLLSRHLSGLTNLSIEQRVARKLLLLSARFPGLNGSINLRLNQDDIAQYVGASRQTVNECVRKLSDRGWILTQPRKRYIAVPERVALADFCLGRNWRSDMEGCAIYGVPEIDLIYGIKK